MIQAGVRAWNRRLLNVILVYLDRHTMHVVFLILLKHSIFIEPPPLPFRFDCPSLSRNHVFNENYRLCVDIFFIEYSNLNKLAMC